MTLYSLYADIKQFAFIRFDREELREKFGENPKNHIDTGFKPASYSEAWKTVDVTFENADGMVGDAIPDIMEFKAKLFLNSKAYKVLYPLIEEYGEFLPVSYEGESCFIFNPMCTAEDFDAVNESLCTQDEWGDITSIGFYEDRLVNIPIFKSAIDQYQSLICNEIVKQAIEDAHLTGVYFTNDLGCPHIVHISSYIKTN